MSKVLVTGADGFIGSHLTEELVRQGHDVKALVCYNAFNTWGWIDQLEPSIKSQIEVVAGDIRDSYMVKKVMEQRECVYHLAALIAIPYSYHAPSAYVETNVTGTLNVLTAARELDTSRLLVTSTSEVYGTAQYVPIDEKHPYQGQSPYSASKIGADRMAEAFYRSFGVPLTIVRPFNTYGPRQSARAVIPTIIAQLLAGATTIKLGALSPTRDFVFVKDTVKGFMNLSQCKEAIGKEVNIATMQEITIGALAEKLIAKINPDASIQCDGQRLRPKNSEVERLLGDATLLRQLTGFVPKTTIDEGLEQTIDFVKTHLDTYKWNQYNM